MICQVGAKICQWKFNMHGQGAWEQRRYCSAGVFQLSYQAESSVELGGNIPSLSSEPCSALLDLFVLT